MESQGTLALAGKRTKGADVRSQNVLAVKAVANVVRSSLGPTGLDKMLVDQIGEVTITNDGATILQCLDVKEPAGRVLVELAGLQDAEVGDGTTSVVILASELLERANELIKSKIHATTIISGFRLATRAAVKYIEDVLQSDVDAMGEDGLLNAAKTSMSSKIIGNDSDFFARMCIDSMMAVGNEYGKYPVAAVNILKAHGKSSRESFRVNGYALNVRLGSEAMPKRVTDAKIALLDFNLQKVRLGLQVQVLISDPEEMTAMQTREADITKERIQKILAAGANVILTTGGIDDLCLKYFVEAGAMAVRRCSKVDLKRIAKATGGSVILSMGDLEGSETFDPNDLGQAGIVEMERVSDNEMMVIRDPLFTKAASIVLRGANEFMLDEMHRSVHDALCVIKRVLESKRVVPGGGAVETALSVYLEKYATSISSREQVAIACFAEALLVIPKTLAINAAKDSMELVAQLRAAHSEAQAAGGNPALAHTGLDLKTGAVRDNMAAGVVEPAMAKVKAIKFAAEAAATILRVDDIIQLTPPPSEEEMRRMQRGG
ncbi:T-complex protein 1 subunit alpha [Thecamonas trahens ATCC 50062]|uniref:T-complex protein 1 subunit alpha n=1 Tax=Thecamonas trahens ATCC 50062 TaxID=461836 RepID=A0A0L0DSM9_THETB|nr:T-complex protein 1 subunit alpha [Thecamonas trahens ATCC 50062]KNC55036.1 T-complex protein 1 subunit alpha [Thecamonas trahens ATCC 50062]|eukprot:XP_013753342.1 T-complex protein 1 subunit alpha [Thecamonas trahens ATCC 50062]